MRLSTISRVPAILTALTAVTSAQSDGRCYFPNGDYDYKSSPCDKRSIETGGQSACCINNDPCYEDGTCATYNTLIPYRGSCTDPTWSDGACATETCMDPFLLKDVAWIVKCFPRNDTSCCLMAEDTCCFDDTFFEYNPGPMVALLDSDGSNVLSTGTGGVSQPTETGNGDGATATTTVTTTATATTSAAPEDTGTDPAVIGLGVTLGVVVLAGAVAVGLLWGKLQSERKAHHGAMMASPQTMYHQPALGTFKPPEHTIPPAQVMPSPQQMYAPTPVELHSSHPNSSSQPSSPYTHYQQ